MKNNKEVVEMLGLYHAELVGLVRSRGVKNNPEDYVQNMYLKLLSMKSTNHLDKNKKAMLQYAKQMLKNAVIDESRKKNRLESYDSLLLRAEKHQDDVLDYDLQKVHNVMTVSSDPYNEEREIMTEEFYEIIENTVRKRCSKRDADIFIDKFRSGISFRMLSDEEGVNHSTLFNAVDRCKEVLKEHHQDDWEHIQEELNKFNN